MISEVEEVEPLSTQQAAIWITQGLVALRYNKRISIEQATFLTKKSPDLTTGCGSCALCAVAVAVVSGEPAEIALESAEKVPSAKLCGVAGAFIHHVHLRVERLL